VNVPPGLSQHASSSFRALPRPWSNSTEQGQGGNTTGSIFRDPKAGPENPLEHPMRHHVPAQLRALLRVTSMDLGPYFKDRSSRLVSLSLLTIIPKPFQSATQAPETEARV